MYYVGLAAQAHVIEIAYAELVIDQATWTALIYVTGGATSGATALYGLTCLGGRHPHRSARALRGGDRGRACSYSLLCAGFVSGVIGPPPDQPRSLYVTELGEVVYPLFINLLVLMVVMLLAEYLAERLRLTGGRLEEATQRAEDAERLAASGAHRRGAGARDPKPARLHRGLGAASELDATGWPRKADTSAASSSARPRGSTIWSTTCSSSRARDSPFWATSTSHGPHAKWLRLPRNRAAAAMSWCATTGRPRRKHRCTRADAGQLRQVVWNLVRNAVQASSPGAKVMVRVNRRSRKETQDRRCGPAGSPR